MTFPHFLTSVQTLLTDFRENGLDYPHYLASHPAHGNEAIVRQKIVEKLLVALGYSLSTEVQPEERAGSGSADIVVKAIGPDPANPAATLTIPASVWELKKTGETDLSRHEKQLEAYVLLKHVRYGILTNGQEIRLYERVGEQIEHSFSVSLLAFAPGTAPLTPEEQIALHGLYDILHREAFLDVERYKQEIVQQPYHSLNLSPEHPHNEDLLVQSLKQEIGQLKRLVLLNFRARQSAAQLFDQELRKQQEAIAAAKENVLKTVTDLQERLHRTADTNDLNTYLTKLQTERMWATQEVQRFVEEAINHSGVKDLLIKADKATFESWVRIYFQAVMDHASWRVKQESVLQTTLRLVNQFQRWREEMGIMAEDAATEFCLQTVYIFMTRLLLIRICEDKGILKEKISDGGYATYLEFSHRFYDYMGHANRRLLSIAYDDTSYIYGHFFSDTVFDWYTWEEETIVRLFWVLNRYNFAQVSADLIGRIYEQYVDELERKRKGQFYTPATVVGAVLDAAAYQGKTIVGKKLLDPACGSGRFLVEAARRLIPQWEAIYRQQATPNQPINYEELVNERLRHALFGLDVNRFACFLAEVNLVVQVLDLFKGSDHKFTILRFHIYPTNSLLPDELNGNGHVGLAALMGNDNLSQERLIAELIKEKQNHPVDERLDFRAGFDYIVGNPPYVRADHLSVTELRRRITATGRYPSLYKKWDLYIPFIDLALNLLAEGGHHAFIVSDAFETEEYARQTRERLLRETTIRELVFAPGVYFFEGAAVYTFIYGLEKKTPEPQHLVQRRQLLSSYLNQPGQSKTLVALAQVQWGEQIFRPEFTGADGLDFSVCLPLQDICYVNSGMELQSHEKFGPVIQGKRQSLFVKDDLISPIKDKKHPKPYLEGKDLGNLEIDGFSYLEWNTDRVPSQLRRSRFPELFTSPKIMMGETSGIYLDQHGEFLNNHSVRNFVLYQHLVAQNIIKQVSKALAREISDEDVAEAIQPLPTNFARLSKTEKAELLIRARAIVSQEYDLRYLTAILNCRWLREYMMTYVKRGSRERLYPDDLKQWPVAPADAPTQAHIGQVVQTIMAAKMDIQTAKASGHLINDREVSLNPGALLREWQISVGDVWDAAAFINTHITGSLTREVTLEGEQVVFRRQPRAYLASDHAPTRDYLHRYLRANYATLHHLPAEQLGRTIKIPRSPNAVESFMARLQQEENRLLHRLMDAAQNEALLEERLFDLYNVPAELRQQTGGRLITLSDVPAGTLYVSLLTTENDNPLYRVAFPWQSQWAIRTKEPLPATLLLRCDSGTDVTSQWIVV